MAKLNKQQLPVASKTNLGIAKFSDDFNVAEDGTVSAASAGSALTITDLSSQCNGVTTIFTATGVTLAGLQDVRYNGVYLNRSSEFVVMQNGANVQVTLTLNTPPQTGEELLLENGK